MYLLVRMAEGHDEFDDQRLERGRQSSMWYRKVAVKRNNENEKETK